MASINLSGILELPLGGSTRRRRVLFTHLTATGEVIPGFTSIIEIGESGEYDIDVNYGNVNIRSYDPNNGSWINHGVRTINSDTVATTLPELIGVVTPATDEELLIIQSLIADVAQSAADAEASAAAAEASAIEAAGDSTVAAAASAAAASISESNAATSADSASTSEQSAVSSAAQAEEAASAATTTVAAFPNITISEVSPVDADGENDDIWFYTGDDYVYIN